MSDKLFVERAAAHLGLLAGYVIFTGLVATEAYYAVFGIRYQTLQFSAEHVIYRGLTNVAGAPALGVPLALALLWLVFADRERRRDGPFVVVRTILLYVAAFLIVGLTFRISQYAGASAGERDLMLSTTTLPAIETMSPLEGDEPARVGDVVLWLDDGEMIAFTPLASQDSVAVVKRVLRSEIHGLSITRSH